MLEPSSGAIISFAGANAEQNHGDDEPFAAAFTNWLAATTGS